ncbi:Arm DNA-binding domain-containing protein [Sphingomonas sp. LaA6.9]|uniref:Arm DNA-binding domain-containing protein n=1 Tax=Sphingomonas sp. LaA6.9 TaxID=2919914 RepID=UPI001F4F9B0A|nr:Arm DNA-binding domain-containing protein [Sphingomonas sp. LaA6.9]MCJ8158304.1 Arm DNA-binding domain-containing protein [Sphingomonas sp. LaA6.9]
MTVSGNGTGTDTVTLTDAAIRRIKPGDKSFKVSDLYGLSPLVRPDGARYWRMDYRHAGMHRIDDLPYGVIAERLDITSAEVEAHIAAALLHLARALHDEDGDPKIHPPPEPGRVACLRTCQPCQSADAPRKDR